MNNSTDSLYLSLTCEKELPIGNNLQTWLRSPWILNDSLYLIFIETSMHTY